MTAAGDAVIVFKLFRQCRADLGAGSAGPACGSIIILIWNFTGGTCVAGTAGDRTKSPCGADTVLAVSALYSAAAATIAAGSNIVWSCVAGAFPTLTVAVAKSGGTHLAFGL